MRFLSADDLDRAFSWPALVDALDDAFRSDIVVPVRHHHPIVRTGEAEAMMLLMPAWTAGQGGYLGTKVVNVFPGNGARGLPAIAGLYLLMSGETGVPLAAMDGARLTAWRTAAASALASRHLARPDASRLVMVGAGALAPFVVAAHASQRPITHVSLWNRHAGKAHEAAALLATRGIEAEPVTDLESAVREADIVSCATLSREPLIRGAWLKPGAHLDLVGAYTPEMRESDDECVRRARLFVDTLAGALKEGGDIVQPIRAGVIGMERVEGDLFSLCRAGGLPDRKDNDITLFKSVGTAIEDLAAAVLAFESLGAGGQRTAP
jgi:alanine dehydrogenase